MALTNIFDEHNTDNSKKPRNKQSLLGLQILFGSDWEKWNYLPDQLSYVTPCYISEKVAQLAHHYFLKSGSSASDSVIFDMFGGMGMDIINFAAHFHKAIVTEIDPIVFQKLELNIKMFSKTDNILPIRADCFKILNDKELMRNVNTVYFDPPWGNTFRTGVDFKFEDVILHTVAQKTNSKNSSHFFETTSLTPTPVKQKNTIASPAAQQRKDSNMTVMDLIDKVSKKVNQIIIKSPLSSDSFERWAASKTNLSILQICEFPTHKLKYLFIRNKSATIA